MCSGGSMFIINFEKERNATWLLLINNASLFHDKCHSIQQLLHVNSFNISVWLKANQFQLVGIMKKVRSGRSWAIYIKLFEERAANDLIWPVDLRSE